MFVRSCALFVCILLSLVAAQQEENTLCQNEAVQDGNTRFPTEDCTKYKFCVNANHGYIMNCPFPTRWDSDSIACIPFKGCTKDFCKDKKDDEQREAPGHCRGYWKCDKGVSVPSCCPAGQKYNATKNICEDVGLDDPNGCNIDCLGDKGVVENNGTTTTAVPPVCNMTAVPNDTSSYILAIEGHIDGLTMSCAFGTVFSQINCSCISSKVKDTTRDCKPELILTFDGDTKDTSKKSISIQATDVTFDKNTGVFNGNSSNIVIERFNNIEHLKNLVIEIKYVSNHVQLTQNQSIVSNDKCKIFEPSIVIIEDKDFVYFMVGTKNETTEIVQFITIKVPQPTSNEKNIQFKFANDLLTGTVNTESVSGTAIGYLNNVHCALSIGSSENANSFLGKIDDFKVYLCEPKLA